MKLTVALVVVAGVLTGLPEKKTHALRPTPVRVSRSHLRLPLPSVNAAHASEGATRRSRPSRPADAAAHLNWHALALCESTDNPRAVDPTGSYYGLYQFDEQTWRSVGGAGNPADASRSEQTLRARILYRQRGRTPWPVCGARL